MRKITNYFNCSDCDKQKVNGLEVNGNINPVLNNGKGTEPICTDCQDDLQPISANGRI